MFLRRYSFVLLTVFIAFTFAMPSAFAKKKARKADQALSDVLGKIKWGDSKSDVLSKMKKQGMDDLRKDKKLKRDPVLMHGERKRLMARVTAAEKSFTRLDGDHGYDVSVISDEFSSNSGESFIRMKDKVAQRFYFFNRGKFYKLVVSYNPNYIQGVDFEGFVGSSVKKYGRPAVAEYDDIRGKEQLSLVQWESSQTTLRVKNKKELFDTYTMSFADRQAIKRMEASGKVFGGNDKDEDDVSASVQALMEGGDYDANSNVVDGLVGTTDVDLKDGRPKDDQAQKYTDDGAVASNGDGKSKKSKKKKKKKKKRRKKKTKKSPNFGNLNSKASDDLIIY